MARYTHDQPTWTGTPLTRLRLWLLDKLPDGLLARPAEWLLAALCFLAGIPGLFGVARSPSLYDLLPFPFYRVWCLCLILGGAGLMCGLTSIRDLPDGRHVVTRVPCYRLGLRLLALAMVVFAGALIVVAGERGIAAAVGPTLFASFCFIRLLTFGGRR